MDAEPRIDRERLVATARDLVAIDSTNPSLVPGGAGEAEAAEYVAAALREAGLAVALREAAPGRPSVLARLPGTGRGVGIGADPGATADGGATAGAEGGRSLMLNAHLDTVGVAGMARPFEPVVRDGRLFGRGAFDMKGALAACVEAARALAKMAEAGAPLAGDLLVAAVADEEHASLGTEALLREVRPDAAVVTEPTGLGLCLAHRGFAWLEVETLGRAAHGSQFREGVDANLRMGRVLARLEALGRALSERPGHPLLGPPSLHVGLLRGGTGPSTYAERAACIVERRTLPGETEAAVRAEIQAVLDGLAAQDPDFRARLRIELVREPFETSADAPIARTVAAAAAEVLGAEPPTVGENPWMDAALLAAAGVDTVVIGPAGAGAHGHEEWVELDSLERLAEILARTAVRYLTPPRGASGSAPGTSSASDG